MKAEKEEMLWDFQYVFVDELGEADRIVGDPVKLEVLDDKKKTPYH